ncbi:glycosyltransferase involved in cell wall biosynthesis [Stenotrophomonas maltophilia]|uniref:glycosyltransferase family 4 protein n=1 Tax=Stenotrophomonas maltophilia TaxID=40324 RepID=UPI0016216A9E|nr:glycosyltransferase family 4 protein [Stenotrophomonas maltophilia]MBB5530260.1 glycosyltransferase involved in cell wall biosynthesis [Stenotrophomonas maltophilia]
MRILISAHDFSPNPSPQSLRITQLATELANGGFEIDVLTRTVGAGMQVQPEPIGVQVHRAAPGWLEAALDAVSTRLRRRTGRARDASEDERAAGSAKTAALLNWKGRWVLRLRAVVDAAVFPDGRSRWITHALREGRRLLLQRRPQVIIGSHEPAAGLMVALTLSRESGVPLVSELGDPVLTAYTPKRWMQRSFALERRVCRESAALIVTSEATAELLRQRHGEDIAPITVIPQGFPVAAVSAPVRTAFGNGLALVYTGRFYPFRDPAPLFEAVLATPGATLTVAGPGIPPKFAALFAQHPEQLRYVGNKAHAAAVELQQQADVLVSIGNAGMTQIPGKLLEYLGSGRPVLHLQPDQADAAAAIIRKEQCGFLVAPQAGQLDELLRDLVQRKQQGRLEAGLRLGAETFAEYRWDRLAARLAEVCRAAAAAGTRHRD